MKPLVTAYLFKRKRLSRDGVKRESSSWWMRFRLPGDKRFTDVSQGVSDRRVADTRLAEFVQEKEREAAGIIAPRALRDAAVRSLADHLADFVGDLKSLNRAPMYCYNLDRRVSILIDECGWKMPRDVTAESFQVWRQAQRGKSAKTLNEYLDAAKGLCNWMLRRGLLLANPLAAVARVDQRGHEVRVRRPLSDDEMSRLLDKAPSRKAVYLAAVLTGLRRGELKALLWSDVHLDAVRPFLSVRASTTKNRRCVQIFLRDDLVDELRKIRPAEGSSDSPVWGKRVPRMDQYRLDLAAAGIADSDDQGRVVDFHCLRHTLGTNLARSGVEPRVAMEVMRHSEMKLTQKTYVDAAALPMLDVLDKLPRFEVEVPHLAVAVGGSFGGTHKGTHDSVREGLAASASVPPDSSAKLRKPSVSPGKSLLLSADVPSCPDVPKSWGSRIRT